MPKLLVGRTTLNGEKKRMHGLNVMWVNTRRGEGGRDEVWDRETMFSQLTKRSPCVMVSG